MDKKVFLIFLSFFTFILTRPVFAHHEELKDTEEWQPVSAGPVTTWTAPLCGKGKLVAQAFLFYNRARGTFNPDGHYDSLAGGDKKYQFQQQLFLQYGLSDSLEIDGQLVYQENFIRQSGRSAHSDGLGDSYLFLRDCLIEERELLPHATALLQLKLPTGKFENADPNKLGTDLMGATSGGGSYDFGLGLILTKKVKPFIFHADWVYSFPQEVSVDDAETRYARYLNYDFGFEYFLSENLNLALEFNGFLQGDKKQSASPVPATDINYLTIGPGIGWSNEKIQTLIAYQRVLIGTNTDASDSLVVTFVYSF